MRDFLCGVIPVGRGYLYGPGAQERGNMKHILFASSEAVPFIKTGGLADVAGSLPGYFPKSDYDVRVVIPKYLCMDESVSGRLELVAECQVQLNWRTQYAGIYQLEENGITYYFIDNEYYFAGPAPYGQIYQDAEKFAYFSKAVLTALPVIGFRPDVIHCHDWQTGLIPVFLEAQFRGDDFYRHIRTVYTIHNLKFQGRWYIDAIRDVTGLPADYFTMDTLESYGQANLLKGGVVFSDYVTTVSESYAKEIQTMEGGEGLDGLMRMKSYRLAGILNGLDYDRWDPSTDPKIAQKFTGDITAYKKANKADLQESYGLTVREDAFLIGMVSRLTDQKGFDLVDYILDEILYDERMQIIVLGTGEERYENMFRYYAGKYPGRVSANICYSDETAQKIYASCDAFLMPSQFEPCGLSQLMSLRYGTVPMVRETGGLKDTVEPYNEFEHTGTGFSFHNYNAHEMLYMIRYAHKIYELYPEEWLDIIRRGMAMDFSWKASSVKYAEIYDMLIADEEKRKSEEERRREEAERQEQKRREEELLMRMRLEKQLEREEEERKRREEEAAKKKAAAAAKRKATIAAKKKAKEEAEKKAAQEAAKQTAETAAKTVPEPDKKAAEPEKKPARAAEKKTETVKQTAGKPEKKTASGGKNKK